MSNPESTELTLEHVLPLSPLVDTWDEFNQSQKEDFVGRLRNLCLVTKTPNEKLGNRPFSGKTATSAAADLFLTKKVAGYDK